MTPYISASLRRQVVDRAQGKCEYCLIQQNFSIYSHEIDHVVAVKHGGQTIADNLVLSCLSCNRYKGSDLTSIDPVNGEITPLFNPRSQNWTDHFKLEDGYIVGLTAIGRTTIFLLKLNDLTRVQIRQALIMQNLYP
ncbi:HNH endonuclease [Nostoc sp. UHCC 0702]|nr:HNH endonuclease [Nostoc sp. UHCC 0702]